MKQLSFEAKELQNKAQQDPTLLKKVAVHLGVMLEKYAEFEESWPKVAALMLPAISIATKTAVGGAVGGGAGAGAGLMSGIGAEVSSAITGLIIGDSVGQITENASNYLSGLLQKADDTLTKDEARNIVAALLLTATTYKYFKSEIVDIKNFKHSINPKVSDFNQTKTFDLEKPQIDMFEGGESKQSWKDVIKKKKKEYPDTVEKINNRFPINADNAGKKYPLDKLPPELQVKYPNSIDFDHKGCARFEPYTYKDEHGKLYKVELDKFTHRGTDSAKANEIMGITDVPFGYTWHHVEDGKTMIAIPRDLHEAIRHTGGMSYSKGLKSKKNDK